MHMRLYHLAFIFLICIVILRLVVHLIRYVYAAGAVLS